MNTEIASNTTRTIISKKKKSKEGKFLQQVVYRTAEGKNKKGKQVYSSQTKHEKQN